MNDNTPEELAELSAHDIETVVARLPPERLALRRSAARKMFERVRSTSWWASRPAAVRAAYEAYPPWKFYTDPGGHVARRAYGVCEYADGTCGLHAITAHAGWINDVVGGVDLGSAVAIDDWTPAQAAIIDKCPQPELFYDPCAWVVLSLRATARRTSDT